jgi:hypothetical protein
VLHTNVGTDVRKNKINMTSAPMDNNGASSFSTPPPEDRRLVMKRTRLVVAPLLIGILYCCNYCTTSQTINSIQKQAFLAGAILGDNVVWIVSQKSMGIEKQKIFQDSLNKLGIKESARTEAALLH